MSARTFNSFKEAAAVAHGMARSSRVAVKVVRRGNVWLIEESDEQTSKASEKSRERPRGSAPISAAEARERLHPPVPQSPQPTAIPSAPLTRLDAPRAKPKPERRFIDNDGFAGSREAHKAMRGLQRGSKL